MNFNKSIKVANAAEVKIKSTINVMGDLFFYRCELSDGTTAMSVSSEPSDNVEEKTILKALYYSGLMEKMQDQVLPLPIDLPELKGIDYQVKDDMIIAVETEPSATYFNRDVLKKSGFGFEKISKSWILPLPLAA